MRYWALPALIAANFLAVSCMADTVLVTGGSLVGAAAMLSVTVKELRAWRRGRKGGEDG